MTLDETIQKLIDLKLHALAKSLREMMEMPPDRQLTFEDKLGLIVDHEWTSRENRRVSRRVQEAKLSVRAAPEEILCDAARGLEHGMLRELGVRGPYLERVTRDQMAEAARRASRFRGDAPAPTIAGRTVILVDDGLATGATMIAAVRAVRAKKPARLIVAVPVGSREAVALLEREADEIVCLSAPEPFWAVGLYYREFGQTEDREVERLLREARHVVASR